MAEDAAKDTAKKQLQSEVVAVKGRWPEEVKLIKASQGSPTYPLPFAVQRTVPRPDSAVAFDLEALIVKLWVDTLEAADKREAVRVEVAGGLPDAVAAAIIARIVEIWKKKLGKGAGSKAGGAKAGWLFETIFSWVEEHYAELLHLLPDHVETYDGVDDNGMTIRRYALTEPAPSEEEEEEEGAGKGEEQSSEEETEEQAAVRLEAERLARIKLKAEEEADRQWREARRREAQEQGEDVRQQTFVSKKEQQRLIQEKIDKKQGHRLRKTGSRANKFDAEAAGKTANKKNGLLH